jgi:hypothetical protein
MTPRREDLAMGNQGTENEPKRERIGLGELVRASDVEGGREISLTRIGYTLALLLFGYLSVVTVFLLLDYIWNAPPLPTSDALDAAKLQEYKQVSELCLDRTLKLLDSLVLKGFLPVFTAVLGYIFGTRGLERTGS